MQVGADNPDEILTNFKVKDRLLNRINSINKNLRDTLRKTYSWCSAK